MLALVHLRPQATCAWPKGQQHAVCLTATSHHLVVEAVAFFAHELETDRKLLVCRANAQQPKLFVGMILILIFAEALALYGLIGELPPQVYLPSGTMTALCCKFPEQYNSIHTVIT